MIEQLHTIFYKKIITFNYYIESTIAQNNTALQQIKQSLQTTTNSTYYC